MSSRVLRKLQGEQLQVSSRPPSESRDGESEEDTDGHRGFSFAMLAALDKDDVDCPAQSENEGEEVRSKSSSQTAPRKKKKKKKKKAKKGAKNEESLSGDEPDDVTNEVERAVAEVNSLLGTLPSFGNSDSGSNSGVALKHPLNVEAKFLNAENELRRIFGSRVVGEQRASRRIPGRRYLLVTPQANWPPISKQGLSMSLVETNGNERWFVFEHNKIYRETQFKFWDAVDTFDPENLMALLGIEPYHLDTLLQTSEIFRMGEDYDASREMISRALYACESALHSSFSLTTGTSRLDYKRAENRPFFLALFRHAMFMAQRACYRTGLEVVKALLSMDFADDPLGVTLLVDHLALQAEEYGWLLNFIDTYNPHRNLTMLPNHAYSRSLALFKTGAGEEAGRALEEAIERFPGVIVPLLDKCGVSPGTDVSDYPCFCLASRAKEPKPLQAIQDLYISRSHHSWRLPEVLAWLERVTRSICSKAPKLEDRSTFLRRFTVMPRNLQRHLVLSDAPGAAVGAMESHMTSFDPLPPLDSVAAYDRPRRARVIDSDSIFSGLLRSLLPNFNIDEPPPPASSAVPAVGDNNVTVEEAIRRTVADVLGNLRELIGHIDFAFPPDAPPPADAGDGHGDSDIEEENRD